MEIDSKGYTPLSSAIQFGSMHAVEEVLRQGGDPLIKDNLGYTALHRAVLSERVEIFKVIAASNTIHAMATSFDSQGYYPIHHALKLGLHEIVVTLLAITSEEFTDPDGNNYLHLAASSGDEQTLSHLLGMPFAQCMLNKANSLGSTPLHCAAMGPSANIVKTLLSHGVQVHKDKNGANSLHVCLF